MVRGDSVLRFEAVSLYFEGEKALDNVSFDIPPGDTRIILGAAGSGKTVILKLALGLLKADAGRIYLFGNDVTDLEEAQWYDMRAKVGVLFQEGGLFDSLNIEENVSYPLVNQEVHSGERSLAPEKAKQALKFVGLENTLEKFPSELSGGMRRRVGIARATVTTPELLLYDSPTAGLDPITANKIISLIIKDRDMHNTTSLIVTHRSQDGHMLANFRYNSDSGTVVRSNENADNGTRFFVMQEGRLVFDGTEEELDASTDPYVSKFTMRK
jgi:phospholipid/cholesterol/gamma-HCH transport system ATP-binding protein